jgi:hypothetical protein
MNKGCTSHAFVAIHHRDSEYANKHDHGGRPRSLGDYGLRVRDSTVTRARVNYDFLGIHCDVARIDHDLFDLKRLP